MAGRTQEIIARFVMRDTSRFVADAEQVEDSLAGVRQEMEEAEGQAERSGETFRGFGGALKAGALGIAAGAGAIATKGVMGFQTIEELSDNARGNFGMMGDELDALVDRSRDMSRRLPQNLNRVGTVLAEVERDSRVTGEAAEELAETYLQLEDITGTNATALQKQLSVAFDVTGVAAEDQADKLDLFLTASQESRATVGELGGAIERNAAVMGEYGLGIDEMLGLYTELDGAGVNAKRTFDIMARSVSNLTEETGEDAAGAMALLHEEIMNADSAAAAVDIARDMGLSGSRRILGQLTAAVQEGNISLDDFGAMALEAGDSVEEAFDDTLSLGPRLKILWEDTQLALAPVGEWLVGVAEDLLPALQDAAGAVFGTIGDMAGNVADIFSGFSSALTPDDIGDLPVGQISVATVVDETPMERALSNIASAAEWVADIWETYAVPALESLADWWNRQGENVMAALVSGFDNLKTMAGEVFGLIGELINAIVVPAFQALSDNFGDAESDGDTFVGTIEALSSAIEVVGGWIGRFSHWVSENRTVVQAAGAGILATWAAKRTYAMLTSNVVRVAFGAMRTVVVTAATAMGRALMFLAANPVGLIITAIGLLVVAAIWLWNNWDQVTEWVRNALTNMSEWFRDNLGFVGDAIANVIDAALWLWDNWDQVTGWISDAVGSMTEWITDRFGWIIDPIAEAIEWVLFLWDNWDEVMAALPNPLEVAADLISNVWDGITGAIKDAVNGVIGAINSMIRAFNNVSITLPTIPDWVPVVGGKGGQTIGLPNIPTIPTLNEGGRVPGSGPNRDTVPAMLTPGEWVLRREAAMALGPRLLRALNAISGRPQGLNALDAVLGGDRDMPGVLYRNAGGLIEEGVRFAQREAGKPYLWGGVGPHGYDCSGFTSAIQNVVEGRSPHQRRHTTASFPSAEGWERGLESEYMVGVFHGSPGHMSGTLSGLPVESRGSAGVVVGSGARPHNHPIYTMEFGHMGAAVDGDGIPFWARPVLDAIARAFGRAFGIENATWDNGDVVDGPWTGLVNVGPNTRDIVAPEPQLRKVINEEMRGVRGGGMVVQGNVVIHSAAQDGATLYAELREEIERRAARR